MVSWKFSISGFWWIYAFWDVLNTIWLFLENVYLFVWCPRVCDKNFVVCVIEKLIYRILWNFIFSFILAKIDFYKALAKIAQQVALSFGHFLNFWISQISSFAVWNLTKSHVRNNYYRKLVCCGKHKIFFYINQPYSFNTSY